MKFESAGSAKWRVPLAPKRATGGKDGGGFDYTGLKACRILYGLAADTQRAIECTSDAINCEAELRIKYAEHPGHAVSRLIEFRKQVTYVGAVDAPGPELP